MKIPLLSGNRYLVRLVALWRFGALARRRERGKGKGEKGKGKGEKAGMIKAKG
jgi:hypothetical protein